MLSGADFPFTDTWFQHCSSCDCNCDPTETALRHFTYDDPPVMTPEQRDWCLAEIDCVEGYYADHYRGCTPDELARAVLHAWADYARDKGLL